MIVRSLDVNNDWNFGKGKNDYLKLNDAIGQSLVTRVKSFLGDCFFDTEAGIDWWNLLGGKDSDAINFAVKTVVLNTDGVVSLVDNGFVLDGNRLMNPSYTVETVYEGGLESVGVLSGKLLTEIGDILVTEDGDTIHI